VAGTTETPETTPLVENLLADLGRIPAPPPEPPDDRGDWGPRDEPEPRPLIENAQLGILIFLAAETMFFAGLIGAYLVARIGAVAWPPPFQPRLPVEITGVNTLFLLASSVTIVRAARAVRRGSEAGLMRGLGQTAFLGALFLTIQGYEWARLVDFGLTASSGMYGTAFYTIIGTHGVHVLAAVAWVLTVLARAARHRYSPTNHVGVTVCATYWHFVVGLWPVLYALVYLV
jgi:heme/copper-type cytochrome/quinol oxidase subunit 3